VHSSSAATSPPARPIWWITHEFAPFRGGAAIYVQEIARAAAVFSPGVQVVAADYCGRLSLAEQSRLSAADAAEPYRVVRLKCSGRLTPAGILRLAVGLCRLRAEMRGASPVLMSVGAQMAAFLLDLAGQFPTGRTVCFFHGSELLRFRRHVIWRLLARRFYARAGGFAVASRYVQNLAAESGLLPSGARICVAPCAVPTVYRHSAAANLPSPHDESTPKNIRILTVARLHPRKGQLQVAEALALLAPALRRRLVYRVVGAGDQAYRHQVEAVCSAAGVRSEFLGDIDERALATLYANCTIYVQASRTLARSVEGFGISLLEAGFFGRPIAAFRSGGVGEAVADGNSAILVEEGNVAGLSAAIARLVADPELRRDLGAAGRAFADKFSWQTSAEQLGRFIQDLQRQ
jgi:phosphatidylinositol alpha-1,6-mannosyltransferase